MTSYLRFPQSEKSELTEKKVILKDLLYQCFYGRDYTGASKIFKVVSDIEVIGTEDFKRYVEMLRHSRNASHWLQLVAKKSLSTGQMLSKRNIKHRSLLLQMFVEIFINDGYLPIAEEMLSSHLADAAYTENPQLIAYSAILTVTKAVSYVNEKKGTLMFMYIYYK
jgi:hypothetical protein